MLKKPPLNCMNSYQQIVRTCNGKLPAYNIARNAYCSCELIQ